MSEEKMKESVEESKEIVEKSSPEKKSEVAVDTIRSDQLYSKELQNAIEQMRIFEENAEKMTGKIDVVRYSSAFVNIKKFEESTEMMINVIESGSRYNVEDEIILKYLNDLKDMYLELNQEIVDITNVSSVSQGAIIKDVSVKMGKTIRSQNVYMESLEKELVRSEDEIRNLRLVIEEKKKKNSLIEI